jgi:hypothetical protein
MIDDCRGRGFVDGGLRTGDGGGGKKEGGGRAGDEDHDGQGDQKKQYGAGGEPQAAGEPGGRVALAAQGGGEGAAPLVRIDRALLGCACAGEAEAGLMGQSDGLGRAHTVAAVAAFGVAVADLDVVCKAEEGARLAAGLGRGWGRVFTKSQALLREEEGSPQRRRGGGEEFFKEEEKREGSPQKGEEGSPQRRRGGGEEFFKEEEKREGRFTAETLRGKRRIY